MSDTDSASSVPVANSELRNSFNALCSEHREINLLGLCTLDGFIIEFFSNQSRATEADKVAAIASSLSALSNSCSMQFADEEFDITIIESAGGTILFSRTNYAGTPCVVTLAASASLSLAQARFALRRFSQEVAEI